MPGCTLSWRICFLLVILQHGYLFPGVESFTIRPCRESSSPLTNTVSLPSNSATDSALFATKKKKKKGASTKAKGGVTLGGFGGAAMEACPCGSGETYSQCCSKVHKDVQMFRKAAPQEIVRARYSAYARKLPEFLMMSTHPNNAAFNPDLRAWKESIKVNMYDKFDLENCVIVEEKIDDVDADTETETATVQFIAEMVLKKTGEKTSFMETSKFEKAKNSGAWLYLSGVIEEAPGDDDNDDDDDDTTEEGSDDGKSMEEKLASQL